ncbi:hypothetical protein L1887_08097 [Cichorium endivia]|nr:hypothetical protein L1887_08097 [Cichorium endivia]
MAISLHRQATFYRNFCHRLLQSAPTIDFRNHFLQSTKSLSPSVLVDYFSFDDLAVSFHQQMIYSCDFGLKVFSIDLKRFYSYLFKWAYVLVDCGDVSLSGTILVDDLRSCGYFYCARILSVVVTGISFWSVCCGWSLEFGKGLKDFSLTSKTQLV